MVEVSVPYIVMLIALLIASPAWASRDVASTNYMDGGTAANTEMSAPFTVAIMFKPDAIGTMQVMISRAVSALNNGWDFRIDASGALSLFNYETDSATGTSTTAPSAGTWYGLAAIMTGSAGSGTVKFVRFTPGTDTLATEDIGMFVGPSPTGTHKLLIGGRWNGALANPATGDYARAGVWSGVALTTAELRTWFCSGSAASGSDGLWALAGSASPEPDTSGNGYDLTLSGTSAGSTVTACPVVGGSGLMLMGVGQ